MPRHLDLSLASTRHGDMSLSARKSPRVTIKPTGPYNGEKGPLSSTSSRFNLNHLVQSPPPSPYLPALVPRHGKPVPSRAPRRCMRALIWLCGVMGIFYFGLKNIPQNRVPAVGWSIHDDQEYEMVGEDSLPDFPTPVVVADKRGRAKWTVSIPPNYDFPLEPAVYAEICRQNMEASNHVADLRRHKHVAMQAHYDYYHVDPYFMDVAEAEKHGMLPGPTARAESKIWGLTRNGIEGSLVGVKADQLVRKEVCKTSMTFVMETTDAGLGPTLMQLWMAYGLAKKEGRAFFVDDSRWAYGNYTQFFKPPPVPECRPPPRHEMLPCPHHARHLVVSSASRRWTFGGAFSEAFEDPRKMEVFRQKPIFQLARVGYEALFNLADAEANYVENRVTELKAKTQPSQGQKQAGLLIGIHVRHGDRHPMEFQYSDSYIPLGKYVDKARDLLQNEYNSSGPNGSEDMMAEMKSIMVLASDDPDVYESEDFSHATRAQEQIRLASKKMMVPPSVEPTGHPLFKRFVEESVGWEGGFFAGIFWSLGQSVSTPAAEDPKSKAALSAEAIKLRELVGRAYLMDLAVLGKASDAVICTVSSTSCRLLAVMMGWEAAIEKIAWSNIDGDFEWRGISW